jgi:hypothetical protein|uniref:10 kDa chaperonin n=1 Tax=Zea mays TaxID=4577 RepID=B7ZY53_MAIZE|nr:unknown [Zea mays]
MAKRLLPSLNRVLVEKLVQPKKTAGGILLPETSKQVAPSSATLFFSSLGDSVSGGTFRSWCRARCSAPSLAELKTAAAVGRFGSLL